MISPLGKGHKGRAHTSSSGSTALHGSRGRGSGGGGCRRRGGCGRCIGIKKIYILNPTAVAELLQYSGSRVEHRDGFSSHK